MFRETSLAWGIDFVHHHGGSGKRYMVETVVGGVVIFDYDRDGDQDVLLVDGGTLPGYSGEAPATRLFRNEGDGFVDRTREANLDFAGYGCGGTAGDYDNDGDLDLYLTAFGSNALYRNNGDGTFTEAADELGVADALWSTSAAFADTDLDGDLDLFVTNYVDFQLENHKFCGDPSSGAQSYCHPDSYEGVSDRFFRNLGQGRFQEATKEVGLSGAAEAGLGVVFSDLDGDLYPELYVANDLDPNLLFDNRQGSFEDITLVSGTGYSNFGKSEAGMGVESADLDGDGRFDLFVTNFALETNALYHNNGGGLFSDRRYPSRIAEPSLHRLGFGVAALDADHDGDLDLVIANGHTLDNVKLLSDVEEYEQPNQLMMNNGKGAFTEHPASGLDQVRVSRGLAYGDLDNDGDLDLVITNSNQPVEVYENVAGVEGGGWLLVDLVGRRSNRDGIGARLTTITGGRSQVRERRTASSYLAQNALSVHFGLAGAERVDLELRWPSRKVQRLEGLATNRRYVVFE